MDTTTSIRVKKKKYNKEYYKEIKDFYKFCKTINFMK